MKGITDRLFGDFETFSEVDLKAAGASRYSRHRSTRPLMFAWALNDDPIEQWSYEDGPFPERVLDMIRNPAIRKHAWNAPFEMQIFENTMGVEIDARQWTCTMSVAMSLALPASLGECGPVVGLPVNKRKDARGKALITKFCKPRNPTKNKPWRVNMPEHEPWEWLDFLTYNRQDVVAERAIWNKVRKWDLSEEEREIWLLDREVNDKGFPINMGLVNNAIAISGVVKAQMMARMKELTGLANPNSPAQLLPWLQDNDYPFDDLKKGHVERAAKRAKEALETAGDNYRGVVENYAEVLELRSQVSKTSIKKYDAIVRAVDDDGNLRNTFQYAGAGRTSRWAGRIFQPQNVSKPSKALEKMVETAARHVELLTAEEIALVYERPMELLSSTVRPAVCAPPGYVFADADLSAIENIVLGWMSGERKILSVFEQGRDPYLDFAQYLFGEIYEALKAEFDAGKKGKRTLSKPGVLGCGYMLSAGETFENEKTGEIEATGLLGYAWAMGVDAFTLDDSKHSVKTWRETYADAVAYWGTIERAARRCIATGHRTEAGPVEFRIEAPFLRMYLPSGRALSYCRPKIEPRKTPWGAIKDTITYEQIDGQARKWMRVTTHPGKLTENADQAIARDLLAHGMMLARKEGLDIRLHVHDQVLTLSREERADEELRILQQCMTTPPSWARDIPLNSGGFTSRIFTKD